MAGRALWATAAPRPRALRTGNRTLFPAAPRENKWLAHSKEHELLTTRRCCAWALCSLQADRAPPRSRSLPIHHSGPGPSLQAPLGRVPGPGCLRWAAAGSSGQQQVGGQQWTGWPLAQWDPMGNTIAQGQRNCTPQTCFLDAGEKDTPPPPCISRWAAKSAHITLSCQGPSACARAGVVGGALSVPTLTIAL